MGKRTAHSESESHQAVAEGEAIAPDVPDLTSLKEAFDLYTRTSRSMEEAYRKLEERLKTLDQELQARNQELALAAALELTSDHPMCLLAAGTDGTDGPTDAAGAFVDGETVSRGNSLGLDARRSLEDNDSYGFFSVEGGLFRTGPTGTNVMDVVMVFVPDLLNH